jgi:uncharacterized Zn finger protein
MAGPLFEHFGVEMTATYGSCTHCGTAARIADLRVYTCAPGTVARCPSCGAVVIVVTEIRSTCQVYLSAFRLRDPPSI